MPKIELKKRAEVVENFLSTCLSSTVFSGLPEGLRAAMNYSLLAGGKRIRPVLCMSSAALFGLDINAVLPFAAGLECIHSYSLVHDDLPAMDNDDFRRGRPSNHKKFNEATAILAGDGLLTDAFLLMCQVSKNGVPAERTLLALAEVARAAGSAGMVGGQFLDMEYTGKAGVNLEDVRRMQGMKTGALLKAACVSGAMLAGASEGDLQNMASYGAAFGAAFQIADDILDETGDSATLGKPAGSDAAAGKNTFPSLLGLEKSTEQAKAEADRAIQALGSYIEPHMAAEVVFLQRLALYTVERMS